MKKRIIILLGVLIAMSVVCKPTANAFDLSINIGDQPYYEGHSYWDDGYLWVWVPGYHEHHHWVHGHYERRGEWHRDHSHEHHHHHHDHDHHDHDHDDHH